MRFVCVCKKKGWECFEDYFDSLGIIDQIILYDHEKELQHVNFNEKDSIFIFRFHLPKLIHQKIKNDQTFKNKCFVFNSEQMTFPFYAKKIKQIRNQGVRILDYSLSNIKIMPNSIYLPYQYNEKEITQLSSFNRDYKWDVGIVDCRSKHRKNVLAKLTKNGINAVNIKGWKDERDKKIGQCRVLLNVHYDNKFKVYEHIRCDRWILAGKLVVSEESNGINDLDIENHVLWCNDANMISVIKNALKNKDENKDVQSIIDNRKKYLTQFLEFCKN